MEQTKNSTSENTVFTGLMEGESYTVEVVAVNNVGNSDAASSTIDFSGMFPCKANNKQMVLQPHSLFVPMQFPLHLVV